MRANRETLSKALRAAVPKSLPVCVSFLFLALSYGVLMGTKGFSFVWPMCMSAFIFTGSMEFVTVNLLLSAFNPIAAFLLAIMIGARHIFYGISMLGKYRNMGVKKFYLIYGLCDETFAVNSGAKIPQGVDHGWFYCFVTLLNQFYWVLGATLGGLLGERLSSLNANGLEFILTGLFVVVFLDQWMSSERKSHMAALLGIVIPVICLTLFGPDGFMVPSLVIMLMLFLVLRRYLDDLEPEDGADTGVGADAGVDALTAEGKESER